MHSPLRQQLLDQVLHIIERARPLVEAVARRDRDLGSQIRRTLSSVGLNLSEGFGSAAGNARLRFESARGSLDEAQAGLRVAVAWGYLSAQAWLAHRKRSPIRWRFTTKDARIKLRRLYPSIQTRSSTSCSAQISTAQK